MTLETDVGRLARTRPFDLLPRDAVQLIAFASEKRKLAANDLLFEEGDVADAGYFVLSGAIELSARSRAGERKRTAGAGALIGENAIMAEVSRPCSARASEPAIVMKIPRAVFHRVLEAFPNDAARLREALGARTLEMAGRLEDLRKRTLEPAG
jgi:CRP-like cAMP-binding protein